MTARARAFLRHLAGFAVGPVVIPIALGSIDVGRALLMEAPPGHVASMVRSALVATATTWLPLGYAVSTACGVPIVLALRAARRLTAAWVVGASAATAVATGGAALLVALGAWNLEASDVPPALALLGIAVALAAAVSGVYCAVAGVPLRAPAAPASSPAA